MIKEYLKKLLSEVDNETPCVARLSIGLAIVAMIALAAVDLWINKKFDPQQFGVGAGGLFAGGAALLWGKRDKETP